MYTHIMPAGSEDIESQGDRNSQQLFVESWKLPHCRLFNLIAKHFNPMPLCLVIKCHSCVTMMAKSMCVRVCVCVCAE